MNRPRSPIEILVDRATGFEPSAPERGAWPYDGARSALRSLAARLYEAKEYAQAGHAYHDAACSRGVFTELAFRRCVRKHFRQLGQRRPETIGIVVKGRVVPLSTADEKAFIAAWVRFVLERLR